MMMQSEAKPTGIVLVGAGNVASHLAKALAPHLSGIYSRNTVHAKALAEAVGVVESGDLTQVGNTSPKIVIVSVADKAVADVAAAIGTLAGKPLIVHTSGTIGMEMLSQVSERVGVLYPLQTFSAGTPVNMAEVPFFTETAFVKDHDIVDAVARLISQHVYHADASHRRVLHIAGVFTSNFTNILLESTQEVLAEGGYGLEVVKPLIEATVAKAFAVGPHAAQTGPARRGDFEVINRQEAALPDHLREVYNTLTNLILRSHGLSRP